MKILKSEKIPQAKGHYSHCVEHAGILYISGQLPIDFQTGLIAESIEDQTSLVLKNIETILLESGSSKDKVLQVRIYISDVGFWGVVNEIYGRFFDIHKPARCIVPVSELHYGCLIEVEAIAYV